MMEAPGEYSAEQIAIEEQLDARLDAHTRAEETRQDAWLAEGREDWA